MENNFDTYLFRCSSLGNIVTPSGKLTDTAKTYIKETFLGGIYDTRKEINSKYFDKGLFEEESGITLLNNTLYKGKLLTKNKERKNNEYIHGECDCVKDGILYDIKNAWDVFTFGKAQLTHNYEWQIKGYLWLWGVTHGRLFYCLNNTPEHLLINEEKRLFYSGNYISFDSPDYIKDCEALRAKHNYDKFPLEERFKIWDVYLTDEDSDKIIKCVSNARGYMLQLWNEHNERIEYNKLLMNP